jgi:hypothetical protein
MKGIIDRARSAMTLVLILSILAWWLNHFSIDVLKEIRPDFTSVVETVDDYYEGSYYSILNGINTKESQFISSLFGALHFLRPYDEDSSTTLDEKLRGFAKKWRMIDIMKTSEALSEGAVILTAETIENGSMEIGSKYNDLTRILVRLANAYNNLSDKLKDYSSQPALDDNATILEAHRALQKKVGTPFLDLTVNQPELNKYFALSVGLVLIYILSTTFVMHRLCKTAPIEETMQWIFFHPTPVGVVLGALWVLSPAATLAVNQQWLEALILGALALVVIGSAIRCRAVMKMRK